MKSWKSYVSLQIHTRHHNRCILSHFTEYFDIGGAAYLEAALLFREFEAHGTSYSLPEMSEFISRTINEAKDALSLALDTLSEEDRTALLPLFRAHLPKTIAELGFDQVHERVPDQYIKNAIASCLASKLVYKEGTLFVSSQPKAHLASMALKYLEKEKEMVRHC